MFDGLGLDLDGFWPGLQDWFQVWFVPAKQVSALPYLAALADRGSR
jgi:hypothetical protein